MALHPSDYSAPERLQPGARGEIFQANQPGYRDGADRLNRTNTTLRTSQHDVPNIKFLFDSRLPVLFKYGFAHGFNQIVVPKGRLVASDPHMDLVDFETTKQFNTLTLANGGVPVRIRQTGDLYKDAKKKATAIVSTAAQGKELLNIGKDWTPLAGQEAAYTEDVMRPFATSDDSVSTPNAQLTAANLSVSAKTGKVVDSTGAETTVRPGNIPIGMIERNEYTRNDDAYNGIMPGPILTDAMVELPWFAFKDKAEDNPWGSAYGNLFPGALLRSDENGRFTISALSYPDLVAKMSIAEYELERQQVVGSVYSVSHDLVPEGAAEWATWALSDRMNSEEFNPAIYTKNNRKGEDAVNSSPFNSDGKNGYPFEKNYLNHDLHMLASQITDTYDPRMNPEYQYSDLGIPGLTDGYNAVVRDMPEFKAGVMHYAGGKEYVDMFFRNLDVNVEPDSFQISINDSAYTNCVEGAKLQDGAFVIKYASPQQGIVVIAVEDKGKADAFLQPLTDGASVKFKYKKRGLAGVPTFMDWDGVVGSVHILLQK